jgi:hypothetical protein
VSDVRESQYVEPYLDENAGREPCNGIAVGSYLRKTLRGYAANYWRSYCRSLSRALERRAAAGVVVRLPSAGGGVAYHRVEDLDWPIALPLMPWAQAQGYAAVPVEIDCAHHLRLHEVGGVTGFEIHNIWVINRGFCETLRVRTVTLERPQGPGDPAVPLLQAMFAEAAQALAAEPDIRIGVTENHDGVRHPVGLAAALLHAQDCLQASAIARAVTAEIERTGRVSHALRSTADPAWVAARALETA